MRYIFGQILTRLGVVPHWASPACEWSSGWSVCLFDRPGFDFLAKSDQ